MKCCVFFVVQDEFLNIIYKSFGFKGFKEQKKIKERKCMKKSVCALESSVPGQYINITNCTFPRNYNLYEWSLNRTNTHLNGWLLLRMVF
jgi:hypothetical protein